MKLNSKIDALSLMLTDLRTRNEPIRHKAAFKGCQPEFQNLVTRLIRQLEDELEACEYKIRCEMDFIRKELEPLKKQKLELLERLKEL